jgi:hypothetical protein
MIQVRDAVPEDAGAIADRDDRYRMHRFYAGLGFESGSRKFIRPVAV